MDSSRRIEQALEATLEAATAGGAPPRLAAALRHALFPPGGRLRPRLCLAVASACGDPAPEMADAAAAAIELLHCASLVHDDLPCFDDAPMRRGQPTIHRAFNEPLAVLVGDALIVFAFETLARASTAAPARLSRLIQAVARGVSTPHGLISGQAWESESRIPLATYRRAKTGALFEAAAVAGAIAADSDGEAWRAFGLQIGEAYQIADDILDVAGDPNRLGKPTGRDTALGRPNAVNEIGILGSQHMLERLVRDALNAIPLCEHPTALRTWVSEMVSRMLTSAQPPCNLCETGSSAR